MSETFNPFELNQSTRVVKFDAYYKIGLFKRTSGTKVDWKILGVKIVFQIRFVSSLSRPALRTPPPLRHSQTGHQVIITLVVLNTLAMATEHFDGAVPIVTVCDPPPLPTRSAVRALVCSV